MNVSDQFKIYSIEQLQELYKQEAKNYAVACINLYGELNVSMMIRTSAYYQAKEFFILGRRVYDKRGSVGMEHYLPTMKISTMKGIHNNELDLNELISQITILKQTYTIISVEQDDRAVSVSDIKHISNPCFIFGAEDKGVPKEILDMSTYIVQISSPSLVRSLNVAIAHAIVLSQYNQ